MVSRYHDAIDGFSQGEIEAVIKTSVSIECKQIGHGKQAFIGMALKREMLELFENGLSISGCQFVPPNLFSQDVAQLQDHKGRDMEVCSSMLSSKGCV